MRITRYLVAVLAVALSSGCGLIPTGPSSSDAFTYEVTGTGTLGLTQLTYASPTAGAIQTSKDLNVSAFESPVLTGFGQNANATPAITATATANGSGLACVTARILKNGNQVKESHDCGSPTITVSAK